MSQIPEVDSPRGRPRSRVRCLGEAGAAVWLGFTWAPAPIGTRAINPFSSAASHHLLSAPPSKR